MIFKKENINSAIADSHYNPSVESWGAATVVEALSMGEQGSVLGLKVVKGCIPFNANGHLVRDGLVVEEFTGSELHQYKRFVPYVEEGGECALKISPQYHVEVGDRIEFRPA